MREIDKSDVAVIETIIRQGWLDSNDPSQAKFDTWLEVDQDQALALISMIPGRLSAQPKPYAAINNADLDTQDRFGFRR